MSAVANDLEKGFEILWYKIESVLGRGGFGITYLATDTNLGQLVAIKEYLPNDFAARIGDSTVQPVSKEQENMFSWGLERFMSEAQTLAKFRHANIVRVLSVFKHNNTGYMVMEYEDGQPLSKVYKEKKRLSQQELEAVYYPIMDGLAAVHEQGFIHRDIKPANIFLREDGTPVLLDFGAARQAVGGKTRTLTSMLSVGYAPLEQYNEGTGKQGPWTDIYALSACLYQGITGSKPMESTQRGMALLHSEPDPYTPLSWTARDGFSYGFLRGIDQGLMIQVHDRPQTLEEFLDILRGDILLDDIPRQQGPENKPDLERTVIRPVNRGFTGRKVSRNHDKAGGAAPESYELPTTAVLGNSEGGRPENLRQHAEPLDTDTAPGRSGSSNKTRVLLVAALLTVISVIGWLFLPNADENPVDISGEPPVTAESAPPVSTPVSEQKVRLNELLEQADSLYAAGTYLNQGQDHALSRYLEIWSLDNQHPLAGERLAQIGAALLADAQEEIRLTNLSEARALLDAVSSIPRTFPRLAEMNTRLAQALQKQQKLKRMEALLIQAGDAVASGRVYSPEGKSALDYYHQALTVDPDNAMAELGLQQVAEMLLSDARQALADKKYKDAQVQVDLLAKISPQNPAVKDIRMALKSNSRVELLLIKADQAYQKQHYTIPDSGSAVSLYKEVLTLSSDNRLATSRLNDIADRYAAAVKRAIRAGKARTAEYNLNILRKHFPDFAGFPALNAEVGKLKAASSVSHLLPQGINQQRGDDAVVEAIVDSFVRSFRERNITRVKQVVRLSQAQESLYTSLFEQYRSLDLELVAQSFTINKQAGLATAKFKITGLVDKSGRVVTTSAGWTRLDLAIRKKDDVWLKAEVKND